MTSVCRFATVIFSQPEILKLDLDEDSCCLVKPHTQTKWFVSNREVAHKIWFGFSLVMFLITGSRSSALSFIVLTLLIYFDLAELSEQLIREKVWSYTQCLLHLLQMFWNLPSNQPPVVCARLACVWKNKQQFSSSLYFIISSTRQNKAVEAAASSCSLKHWHWFPHQKPWMKHSHQPQLLQ